MTDPFVWPLAFTPLRVSDWSVEPGIVGQALIVELEMFEKPWVLDGLADEDERVLLDDRRLEELVLLRGRAEDVVEDLRLLELVFFVLLDLRDVVFFVVLF